MKLYGESVSLEIILIELFLVRDNIIKMEEFTAVPVGENTNNENDIWRSCCIKADKQAVVYITTMTILSGIITFCCIQLTRLEDCNSQSTYISLLSATVGLIVPSPMMNRAPQ